MRVAIRGGGLWLGIAACGPEVIQHGDGGADGGESSTSGDIGESSTGDAPPVMFPGPGPYGGGTRLAAVVERSEDGATRFSHWYDREQATECEFARDSEGTLRCLPRAVQCVSIGWDSESCGVPMAGAALGATAPTLLTGTVMGAASCPEGTRHEAYRRGAPQGAGVLYTSDVGVNMCANRWDVDATHTVEVVDATSFVAGTFVEEPFGDLRIGGVVAEDGSYQRNRLIDARTGLPCPGSGVDLAHLDMSCSVDPVPVHGRFADAGCTQRLAEVPDDGTCSPVTPDIASDWVDAYWLLGPVWEGIPHEIDIDGDCVPAADPNPTNVVFHSLGDAIERPEGMPYRLAPMTTDPGRLQRFGLVDDAGEILPWSPVPSIYSDDPPSWYDSLLELECTALLDTDGVGRCAPAHLARPQRLDHWGDATCSETPLYDTVDADPVPSRISLVSAEDCRAPTLERMQNVVGVWTGDVYYLTASGDCEPDSDGNDGFPTYLQLGNYVELKEAPLLDVVTDD